MTAAFVATSGRADRFAGRAVFFVSVLVGAAANSAARGYFGHMWELLKYGDLPVAEIGFAAIAFGRRGLCRRWAPRRAPL